MGLSNMGGLDNHIGAFITYGVLSDRLVRLYLKSLLLIYIEKWLKY